MAVLADPTRKPDGRRSKACSANKGNLERLKREPGRYPVSDAPGMFFKVKAPGKAFWTYRYRFGGRESELSPTVDCYDWRASWQPVECLWPVAARGGIA